MNPFSSGSISSTSVWTINRACWFLVDAISAFLEREEVGGTGEGESLVVSGARRMRLAAEFSIRAISYGGVTVSGVGKGSTPLRTDTSDGVS
jgi:hypothetical protein